MEQDAILIRYSEIFLKGKNRGYFERVLKNEINSRLVDYGTKLEIVSGRYIVSGFDINFKHKIISILQKVPGIYSLSPAITVEASVDEIKNVVREVMKDKVGSFRVTTTRADKNFPIPSMEFARELGAEVLRNNHTLKVDLHNPQINLQVDIRTNNKAYIYFEELMGVGGMSVGTAGNGLLLLSGGIDSPVAGFMMIKRGLRISALHFESFPYTSPQALDKAKELAGVLAGFNGQIDLYVANISRIQEAIHENCHPDYMITLVRRFMLRIANKLTSDKNLGCLISGESLAQVASQTLESMTTIGEAWGSDKPFFKPLIGFDKIETIRLAERIGSYEISIRPYDDCCTVFLPDSPVIKPRLDRVRREEQRLGDIDELVEDVYKNLQVFTIKP
ncbi:MAG: tRNA 4-thiouridine(8) synthase ThiI [Clostridia bacterium]|nr:tRNA 4-thiouridine(8) synthase ThiI [Clostridia bacterium]